MKTICLSNNKILLQFYNLSKIHLVNTLSTLERRYRQHCCINIPGEHDANRSNNHDARQNVKWDMGNEEDLGPLLT